MFWSKTVSTKTILGAFAEEIGDIGGQVTDTFHEKNLLYARSILPRVEEVRPGDGIKGGVALKAIDDQVWVHPYLFRLVCRNGAIRAETIQSQHLSDLKTRDPEHAVWMVREAVRACSAPEVFIHGVGQMRSATERQADMELTLLPLLARFKSDAARSVFRDIMKRFIESEDRSQFGLMNAVTSVARDTRDPEQRWNLEELGGAVPAITLPSKPSPLMNRLRNTARSRGARETVSAGAA